MRYPGTPRLVLRWACARALAVALLAPLAAGCGAAAKEFRHQPDPPRFAGYEESLPTVRFGDAFFVQVTVNDRGPFLFLLDTGSNATVVSPELARVFRQHSAEATGGVTGATGDRMEVEEVLHDLTLRAGPVEFPSVDAVVVDLSGPASAIGHPMDGILGFPLFVELTLTIDWPGGDVRVSRQPLPAPDDGTIVVMEGGYRPMVRGSAGGGTHLFLIDSGSNAAMNIPALPPRDALAADPIRWFAPMTITGRGAESSCCRLAGDLRIGGIVVPRPLARVSAGTPSVGTRILRRFEVTFDPLRGRVRFLARGAPPDGGVLRSIGAALVVEGDRWRVIEVLGGSPAAAAGIREGDRVLTMDGKRPGEVELPHLYEERGSVEVVLADGGSRRAVTVAVREYL